MQRIDRLLLKAQKIYGTKGKALHLAFVTEEEGRYKAVGQLWNGKDGSLQQEDCVTSWHDTQEEAIEAIHKIAEEYPNREDVLIFLEDFGEE